MEININNLQNKKKRIYEHLWKDNTLGIDVKLTGKSDHSYEMVMPVTIVDIVGNKIAENFKLDYDLTFKKKFEMACSGSGDEIKKITTLHSSSLCAFLFFYNTDNKYLEMEIPEIGKIIFYKSFFEFKNKVIKSPSNVDVVLLGEAKDTNKKYILFLESKFSEYITGINNENVKYEIGKTYFDNEYSKPIYDNCSKFDLNKTEDNHLFCSEKCYIEGLKQIISHYVGIRNFMNGDIYDKEDSRITEVKNYYDEGADILLGEILFDNFDSETKTEYLDSYDKKYEKLADVINKQINKEDLKRFTVIPNSLRYSELKDLGIINSEIKQFYFGRG